MNTDRLKACINSLRELRTTKHQELTTSVIADLDAVIDELEACCDGDKQHVVVPIWLRTRAIEVVLDCLKLVTNLSELIDRWSGPK